MAVDGGRHVVEKPIFLGLASRCHRGDGGHRTYYTIDFPNAAVGIVARRGDEVLLVKQYRFIVDEFVWAIPSGGVEKGETLEVAARRELEEETGYRARSLAPLMFCYASYGCSNQRYEIFLADELVHSGAAEDGNEVLEVRWFKRDELIDLIARNGVVDNLSLSPLLLVLLRDEFDRKQ